MAKVDRRTPGVYKDPLEGYTLTKEEYFIHKKAEYSWDEIADSERQSSPEREIYGPYDTLEEATSDRDFLVSKNEYRAEELVVRKFGNYNYTASVRLPMPV